MYTFYFIVVMTAPAVMLLMGIWWKVSPPPYRSKGLAYSTESTRKSHDSWAMAHRQCSKLWIRVGIVSGVISAALMILFKEQHTAFWVWLIVGQMALFCISVFMIDLLLKNMFPDEDSGKNE